MKKFLNPFRYLAGAKALAIGSIFILATSVLLHAASMVQDNLLHFASCRIFRSCRSCSSKSRCGC